MTARTQEYIFPLNNFTIGLSNGALLGALPGLKEGLALDDVLVYDGR
jgi:hypothetical protein